MKNSIDDTLMMAGLAPGRYENVTLVIPKHKRGTIIAKVDQAVVYIGRKTIRLNVDLLSNAYTNEDRENYAKLAGVSGYSVKQRRMKREAAEIREMEADELDQARKVLESHGFSIYKPEPNPPTEHSA
jgi:hypothetical protein